MVTSLVVAVDRLLLPYNNNQGQTAVIRLVELMIEVNCAEQQCQQFMVIQDYDTQMVFHHQDSVRMIYLTNGNVRIDKQF